MAEYSPLTDKSVRHYLIDQLKPLLPRAWKLYPYSTTPDAFTKPIVTLTLDSITKDPAAPNSHRIAAFVVGVLEPKVDAATREDSLDDSLIDLLTAIETIPSVIWQKAERVVAPNQTNVGYDITINFHYQKEA